MQIVLRYNWNSDNTSFGEADLKRVKDALAHKDTRLTAMDFLKDASLMLQQLYDEELAKGL